MVRIESILLLLSFTQVPTSVWHTILLNDAKNFTRQSPAVPYAMTYIAGPTVLRFPGRERTAFCRPVPSPALGSRPVGPYGDPGPVRTLKLANFLLYS